MTGARRAIAWFTRDLRVHDNPTLDLACRSAAEVLPLFVIDPAQCPTNSARGHFLHGCLEDLRSALRRVGSDLIIRRGDPVTEVARLARHAQADLVVVASDVSAYAQRREQQLAVACEKERLAWAITCSHFVVAPGAVRPPGGDHYKVFTPYWRVWSERRWRDLAPTPQHLDTPAGIDPGALPEVAELAAAAGPPGGPPGGERAARARVRHWLSTGLAGYEAHHDDLPGDRTSRLSADLHFGCLSPLELAVAARAGNGGEPFVRQLCWRDFHAQVTAAFPQISHRDYRPHGQSWRDDPNALERWQAGETGYPVVDAGLRQLATEGFMHNRARLLTASFLTKNLGVHWSAGARHFSALLVDADVSNNSGNWQWVAGTGNDTRPNRRFNPLRQAQRFDPDGTYVRRYVPELASIEGGAVHEPWKLTRPLNYPPPLVEIPGVELR